MSRGLTGYRKHRCRHCGKYSFSSEEWLPTFFQELFAMLEHVPQDELRAEMRTWMTFAKVSVSMLANNRRI